MKCTTELIPQEAMPCAHGISVCPGTTLCFLGSKRKLLLVRILYNAPLAAVYP